MITPWIFRLTLPIFLSILLLSARAQDPLRFRDEVTGIQMKYPLNGKPPQFLFTGSSSIRMWKSLENDFPGSSIMNTAFGGSQMSDLLFYLDELVIKYRPSTIFIYEGDNDLAEGKSPCSILKTTRKLVNELRRELPSSRIVFVNAKPSPSRWHLERRYLKFNRKLERFTERHSNMDYINVWNAMLDSEGKPSPALFISDSLHMNEKGYKLWADLFQPFIR